MLFRFGSEAESSADFGLFLSTQLNVFSLVIDGRGDWAFFQFIHLSLVCWRETANYAHGEIRSLLVQPPNSYDSSGYCRLDSRFCIAVV